MYPRLRLAKDLLTDDGIIFISIDDNEQENLKKCCDEVFGAENHVETIIWKNKYGAGAFTVGFISVHEYIFCYSKKRLANITSELDEEGQKMYSKRDEKYPNRGGYMTQPLMTNSLGDRPNLMYTIEHDGVTIMPRKQWVWSKDKLQAAIDKGEVEFSLQKDGTYSVRSKSYLYDEEGNIRRGKPLSIMNGPFNQEGTKDIRELFDGKDVFDFTKPAALIKKLFSLQVNDTIDKDFIVMDFFSGSATTAQAVMQLNAEDRGHRKFIMVQLPETAAENSIANKMGFHNICEIGEERIRRVGKKIKKDSSLTTEDLDVGFRVFKVDSTNMKEVYYKPSEYGQMNLDSLMNNIKEDRTPEDLLIQVMLDLGVLLSSKIEEKTIAGKSVFSVADGYLIACFDKDITGETVKGIAQRQPFYAVFRDSGMASDSVAANFEQIFETYSPNTIRKVL